MPVWAVDTPSNRSVAEQIWEASDPAIAVDGFTLFKIYDITAREQNCLSQIDMIELHHPKSATFLLIGLIDTTTLRAGFAELGYSLETSGGHLLARKTSA